MKKNALLLISGSLMALASCTSYTNNNGFTQSQVDSAVDARMHIMESEMAIRNDSLIQAMALTKADSILNARATAKPGTITTRTTTTTTRNQGGTTGATHSQGGFGSQSDNTRANDKTKVEGGGFGTQSDKKQNADKKAVQGGGFGTQADKK